MKKGRGEKSERGTKMKALGVDAWHPGEYAREQVEPLVWVSRHLWERCERVTGRGGLWTSEGSTTAAREM